MANGNINAITDLNTVEVSLVKRGANRKRFAFFKSEERMEGMEEMLEAILETEGVNESKFEEIFKQDKMDEKTKDAARGAMRLLSAFKDKFPEDVMTKLAQAAEYPLPEKKQAKEDEEKLAKQKEEEEMLTKQEKEEEMLRKQEEEEKKIDKQEKEDKEEEKLAKQKEEEEMLKAGHLPIKKDGSPDLAGIPVAARPALRALWKQNVDQSVELKTARKEIKKERDLRILKQQTEKAAADYGNLGDSNEIGMIMKSLDDHSPELAKSVHAIFKSADEVISKSQMFATIGSGRVPDAGSAEHKLEAMAKRLVQKSGTNLTYEQAYDRVMKTPEGTRLYDQSLVEKTQH